MRKIFSIVFLTLLLTSAFNIQQVKAELWTIYIRPDESIDPLTAPIQRVDSTYTFTSDIYGYSIVVEKDNIVIDGRGHTLQVTERGTGTGIDLSRRTNVVVRNVKIRNFNIGIYLYSSPNNNISGNNIENNGVGIVLGDSSSNIIIGNNIANNRYDGIALWYSSSNRIYHNNFINNKVCSHNSINVWDDGYSSGGNYWSDYSGKDAMVMG